MKGAVLRRSGTVAEAREALAAIPDSSVIAVSGFNMAATPEYLLLQLLELYQSTGHPRNLFLVADACPAVPGRALDKVAEQLYKAHDAGLLRGALMPFFGFAPWFQKLVAEEMVEGYSWPMGEMAYWFREIASGRRGVISKIGVDTSIDPRRGGGCFNQLACKKKTCSTKRILIDDEDFLLYEAPKPNGALVRATSADAQGNITMEEELMRGTVASIVQATKAHPNPGKVITQVRRVNADRRADPRAVEVPGPLVDFIVVAPPEYHWQSGSSAFNEKLVIGSPAGVAAAESYTKGEEEPAQRVIARRVLLELVRILRAKGKPIVVNLGIGIPALVSKLAQQEKVTDYIVTVLESGQWGGVALSGVDFGVAINPFALSSMPDMFSNFEGGVIDAASLGFLQVEPGGDVNPSMLPGKLFGPGGFPVISGGSPRIYFAGAFMAGKSDIRVENGALRIHKDGETKKFVNSVFKNFFSGREALRLEKEVFYVTERAVFKLTHQGLELTEVAPGVDLDRDVLGKMEFRPRMGDSLGKMDGRIFSEGTMGLLDAIQSQGRA